MERPINSVPAVVPIIVSSEKSDIAEVWFYSHA